MSESLVIAAIVFGVLGLVCLIITILALKKRKFLGTVISFLMAIIAFLLAALFGTITVSIQGYRALTKEELAAIVKVEPSGPQMFTATFHFPDNTEKVFALAGDQLYVDAHILKWKPIINILGLHTAYELDRVSGRYESIDDEKTKARTVFALSQDKPLNMFNLRRKYQILKPLVDAEYGSASFIGSQRAEEFMILVSTTGLLIRRVGGETR